MKKSATSKMNGGYTFVQNKLALYDDIFRFWSAPRSTRMSFMRNEWCVIKSANKNSIEKRTTRRENKSWSHRPKSKMRASVTTDFILSLFGSNCLPLMSVRALFLKTCSLRARCVVSLSKWPFVWSLPSSLGDMESEPKNCHATCISHESRQSVKKSLQCTQFYLKLNFQINQESIFAERSCWQILKNKPY